MAERNGSSHPAKFPASLELYRFVPLSYAQIGLRREEQIARVASGRASTLIGVSVPVGCSGPTRPAVIRYGMYVAEVGKNISPEPHSTPLTEREIAPVADRVLEVFAGTNRLQPKFKPPVATSTRAQLRLSANIGERDVPGMHLQADEAGIWVLTLLTAAEMFVRTPGSAVILVDGCPLSSTSYVRCAQNHHCDDAHDGSPLSMPSGDSA
jgi:hypothetical protein